MGRVVLRCVRTACGSADGITDLLNAGVETQHAATASGQALALVPQRYWPQGLFCRLAPQFAIRKEDR